MHVLTFVLENIYVKKIEAQVKTKMVFLYKKYINP